MPRATIMLVGAAMRMIQSPCIATQIRPTGPFDGHHSEGMESLTLGVTESVDIFQGIGTLTSAGLQIVVLRDRTADCAATPFDGLRMTASRSGLAILTFTKPIDAFGGYFASADDTTGEPAVAEFYDTSGVLVARPRIRLDPVCAWNWSGWTFCTPIGRVEIASPLPGGAFVLMDNLELRIACDADFDDDGTLSIFDFLAFLNAFVAGDLGADFDGDGILTTFDFLVFQNAFDAGCE